MKFPHWKIGSASTTTKENVMQKRILDSIVLAYAIAFVAYIIFLA